MADNNASAFDRLIAYALRGGLPLFLFFLALIMGTLSLQLTPREEEPQIRVPIVDIHVEADGLRAPDAVELVTEPLEDIVKGIDDPHDPAERGTVRSRRDDAGREALDGQPPGRAGRSLDSERRR